VVAFFGAIAETKSPLTTAAQVISTFLDCLAGNSSQLRIRRILQTLQVAHREQVEHQLASHGKREVTNRQLGNEEVSVLTTATQKGDVISTAHTALELCSVFIKHYRPANIIEPDVREREILFQAGPVRAPLRQALPKHQCIIGKINAV